MNRRYGIKFCPWCGLDLAGVGAIIVRAMVDGKAVDAARGQLERDGSLDDDAGIVRNGDVCDVLCGGCRRFLDAFRLQDDAEGDDTADPPSGDA